jgi:hypothetical protein
VSQAAAAKGARAAGDIRIDADAVPGGEAADALAYLDHGPGIFVAEDDRRVDGVLAAEDRAVGPANPASCHLDHDLAG